MFNLLDKVLAIEKAHGPHRDTKLLEKDPLYVKYGPLGLCVDVREKYSDLVTINNRPAHSAVIPQDNLGELPQNLSEPSGSRKKSNEFKCYECDSEYHRRNNCPVKKKQLAENRKKGSGSGTGDGNGYGVNANTDWKFIIPANENAIITIGGIEYFFCKNCVCKNTCRKGFLIVLILPLVLLNRPDIHFLVPMMPLPPQLMKQLLSLVPTLPPSLVYVLLPLLHVHLVQYF